jgi:hypothetical protein
MWLLFLVLVVFVVPASAQPQDVSPGMSHHHDAPAHSGDQWEGSAAGKAYSEFNHHMAGLFVLLIGLSELRTALRVSLLAWTRFLLPVAMMGAGCFLLIWSDHDSWPIGSQTFLQSFVTGDFETVQHKIYALLLLGIGTVEMLRRMGRVGQPVWAMPLPAFAILGGVMLFLHSHGAHPSAHKIAMHHAVMGTMAIAAGSCKLVNGRRSQERTRSVWELTWAGLILMIGVQLLFYSE